MERHQKNDGGAVAAEPLAEWEVELLNTDKADAPAENAVAEAPAAEDTAAEAPAAEEAAAEAPAAEAEATAAE